MKTIIKENKIFKIRILAVALALIISMTMPAAFADAEQEKMLVPMGSTVGIQMYTDGVMVVGLSATEDGTGPSPAALAGIIPGDVITGLGTDKVGCAEDFRQAVDKLDGGPVSVTVKRDGETLQLTMEPRCGSGAPELGLWLRDTIAGIGTLTYYDPQTGEYGCLGHSINDVDSGVIMPMGRGEIMRSTVTDIIKGCAGKPGEICGSFDISGICGSIKKNTSCGIFGELSLGKPSTENAVPMGTENDVALGKATILSTVSGTDTQEFEIEIVRVYRNDEANRSMMIKITDPELLERTGGIVQGMSGSPILQNGKLIGAVTHVMINDPTCGFGVTVEKMLRENDNAS